MPGQQRLHDLDSRAKSSQTGLHSASDAEALSGDFGEVVIRAFSGATEGVKIQLLQRPKTWGPYNSTWGVLSSLWHLDTPRLISPTASSMSLGKDPSPAGCTSHFRSRTGI